MPRAVVVGGGIAGLAAAIGLFRAGWIVSVHESAITLEPLGAALSLWENAAEAMDRLGLLDPISAAGAPITSMLVADERGTPILGPRPVAGRAAMVTRAALQRTLVNALGDVDLQLGQTVAGVEQAAGIVGVRFANGQSIAADLVIDAAGIRSPLASAWGGVASRYAGYGGVLALSDPIPRAPSSGAACEFWGRGERFGVLDIAEERRYWFYMRDAAEGSVAPSFTSLLERANGWPTIMAETIASTPVDRLLPFAIHAKPPPARLGRGRIIAVGDAAHAMEPNLGQGACQAIEDAAALDAIARRTAPERVLAAFEAMRLKRVRGVVRQAAQGRFGAHGPRARQMIAKAFLRAAPEWLNDRVIGSVQTMPDYS